MEKESDVYIKLKKSVTIPQDVLLDNPSAKDQSGFNFPWSYVSNGFAKPPMETRYKSNDGIIGQTLEIEFKGQIVYLDRNGKLFVSIFNEVDVKKVKDMLEKFPVLFEWGRQVREKQDDILEKISSLLPKWKIGKLSEEERYLFAEEALKKVESLLKRFSEAKENIPGEFEGNIGEAIKRLQEAWVNTITMQNEIKKQRGEDEKDVEELFREVERKNKKRKIKAMDKLKKGGLI